MNEASEESIENSDLSTNSTMTSISYSSENDGTANHEHLWHSSMLNSSVNFESCNGKHILTTCVKCSPNVTKIAGCLK